MKKFSPLVICIFLIIGCQAYLPGAYQEEEFEISDLDAKACDCLNDILGDTVYTHGLMDFDSTWIGSVIYENVEEILDSLETATLMVTESDTLFTINTPENVDSNYVSLTTVSDEVVFFFSDYVDMNIITPAGSVLVAESKAIPLETIYYGVSPDTVAPDTIDCSKLKARIFYKLSGNRNLMEIIKTNQTLNSTFRLVILSKIFQ